MVEYRLIMKEVCISESAKAKARDFIDNEKQFQLGFLPTEQSNPITATLEEDFKRSTIAGVQCLQRGDRQMPITMRHVFASPQFRALVDAMVDTLQTPAKSNNQTILFPASFSPAVGRRGGFPSSLSRCGATSSIAVRRN